MNRIEFEDALMSTIVEYISDQVVLRYMEICKKATVLFTGALIGYTDAVAALKELKEDGWRLTAVLSKSADEVLTADRIKKDIDPDAIFVEGAPVNGRQIVDDSQMVIVPELTINTAAKLANCISDNLITNMITRALHKGIKVVAAVDGCCPDNGVRQKLGFEVTDAYKAKLRSNLAELVTYGIVLTTNVSLAEKVDEVFRANFNFPSICDEEEPEPEKEISCGCGCASPDGENVGVVRIDKKVVGRMDIACYGGCAKIIVRKDAIVTQLAKDAAQQTGAVIVRE
jgi:hypothetical protein